MGEVLIVIGKEVLEKDVVVEGDSLRCGCIFGDE